MGKSSKRKAQGSVNQVTDFPKKAKLELTNKPDQESSKKKNKKQENEGKILKTKGHEKTKSTIDQISQQNKGGQKSIKTVEKKVKSQMNKNTLTENEEKYGKTNNIKDEVQFIIPIEFAHNLNKRMKHAVSKKVRNLIKIRQARGEIMNKVDIDILVKEIIGQKVSNKTDNFEPKNDQKVISTNKIAVPKTKKKKLTKKEKKKNIQK